MTVAFRLPAQRRSATALATKRHYSVAEFGGRRTIASTAAPERRTALARSWVRAAELRLPLVVA